MKIKNENKILASETNHKTKQQKWYCKIQNYYVKFFITKLICKNNIINLLYVTSRVILVFYYLDIII